MPSIDFATGLLGGYFNSVLNERNRREGNALKAAQFLLQSGAVRDPNDLLPFLQPLLESSALGSFRKGGKGAPVGQLGKGGQDPWSILSGLIGYGIQGQGGAGQQPGAPPAGAGFPSPSPAPAPPQGFSAPGGTPPGAPAQAQAQTPTRRPFLMTPEEQFGRGLQQQQTADEAAFQQKTAETLRIQPLIDKLASHYEARGFDKSEAYQIASSAFGIHIPTALRDTSAPTGRVLSTKELVQQDPTAKDAAGRLISSLDPEGKLSWQPVRVNRPGGGLDTVYMPSGKGGAGAGAGKPKLPPPMDTLPAAAQNAVVTQLMAKGINPAEATPDQIQEAMTAAGKAGVLNQQDLAIGRETLERIRLLNEQVLKGRLGEDDSPDIVPDLFTGAIPNEATRDVPQKLWARRTAGGMYQDALVSYAENRDPALGWMTGPVQDRVRATIHRLRDRIAQQTGLDTPVAQSLYRTYGNTLTTFTKQVTAVEQSADLFERNLQLAEAMSEQVPRTTVRPLNKLWLGLVLNGSDAPQLNAFEAYIYTVAREYARVATRQTSAAGLTDMATRKAQELISESYSPKAFKARADALRLEVLNSRKSFAQQSDAILGSIKRIFPGGVSGTVGSLIAATAAPSPPQTGATDPAALLGLFAPKRPGQ